MIYGELYYGPGDSRILGSDGVVMLDQRLSLPNMMARCREQVRRLRSIKSVGGFKMIRGSSLRDAKPFTPYYKVD